MFYDFEYFLVLDEMLVIQAGLYRINMRNRKQREGQYQTVSDMGLCCFIDLWPNSVRNFRTITIKVKQKAKIRN